MGKRGGADLPEEVAVLTQESHSMVAIAYSGRADLVLTQPALYTLISMTSHAFWSIPSAASGTWK